VENKNREKDMPVPLIESRTRSGFVVNDNALKELRQLKGPVAVVSIAGMYRTGKSFLMNRCLLGAEPGEGFEVGNTVEACTKGIWMTTTKDHLGNNIVLLDAEGAFSLSASKTHDLKIFVLALTLSSVFIYNCSKNINTTTLDNLSLLTQISQFVSDGKVNAQLVWIIRDFGLALLSKSGKKMTSDEYMEKALCHQGDKADAVRDAIRTTFIRRKCRTLITPTTDETKLQNIHKVQNSELRPKFVDQMTSLGHEVFESSLASRRHEDGSVLAEMVVMFVNALNSGEMIPEISDVWTMIQEKKEQAKIAELLIRIDASVGTADFSLHGLERHPLATSCLERHEESIRTFIRKKRNKGEDDANAILRCVEEKFGSTFARPVFLELWFRDHGKQLEDARTVSRRLQYIVKNTRRENQDLKIRIEEGGHSREKFITTTTRLKHLQYEKEEWMRERDSLLCEVKELRKRDSEVSLTVSGMRKTTNNMISTLRTQIKKLKGKIDSLETKDKENNKAKQELDTLKKAHTRLSQKLKDNENRLSLVLVEHASLKDKVKLNEDEQPLRKKLKRSHDRTVTELQEVKINNQWLEKSRTSSLQELGKYKEMVKDLRKQINEHQRKFDIELIRQQLKYEKMLTMTTKEG
jgi:hypothetical protein